jgi:hypothetical protein
MMTVLRILLALISPVSPRNWGSHARRLKHGDGWAPSMGLIAIGGTVLPLTFAIGPGFNVVGIQQMGWLTWATWAIVCVVAMAMGVARSVIALLRYGPCGIARPRWWFELARICWTIGVLGVAALFSGLLLRNPMPPPFGTVFGFLLRALPALFTAFYVSATVGYGLSFFQGRRRIGRAYECVHYFYTLTVPIGLLSGAIVLWPPQGAWQQMILPGLLGIMGIGWCGVGMISIARLSEASKRRIA